MLLWIAVTALMVPAQTPDPFYGNVPKGVQTFRVTERGETKGYAGLQLDGRWLQSETEITPAKRPLVVYDTPWEPKSETARYGRLKYDATADALRVERLRRGWEDAGYEFIETVDGEIPVLSADLERAERARDMTKAQIPREMATNTTSSGEVESVQKPSFLALWGPHIAAIVVGLVLLALVGKSMIFSDADTWEKIG